VHGVGRRQAQLGKTMAAAGVGKPGRRPRGRSGRCGEAVCRLLGAVVARRTRIEAAPRSVGCSFRWGPLFVAGWPGRGGSGWCCKLRGGGGLGARSATRRRRTGGRSVHIWCVFAACGRWLDEGWCRPAAGRSWGDAGGVRLLGTGALACRMRGCRDGGPGQWLVASRSLQIWGLQVVPAQGSQGGGPGTSSRRLVQSGGAPDCGLPAGVAGMSLRRRRGPVRPEKRKPGRRPRVCTGSTHCRLGGLRV
jgi:hypothetical protein